MRRRFLTTALLAVLLGSLPALPAVAHASPAQLTIFQDDGRLLYGGDASRDRLLDELRRLGVDVIKVHAPWHRLAPGGAQKPEDFRGWTLSSYRDADFRALDGLLTGVRAQGMRILLAPTGPAPGWATRKRDGNAGVWRPSSREFGRFVRALATRYDGRHSDGEGNELPRVRFWSIWNEPNHPDFLQPLGSRRRGYHIAPHIYRRLVRWAIDGLHRAGHRRDSVLFGEVLPIGHSAYGPSNTIKPIHFIREFFCLDRRWRPYRGRAARVRDCDDFRRIRGVTGFAIHPYSRPSGPRTREPSRYDATIDSLERVERALDRAAARGRVRRGMGIYNTEYGFQSDPPDERFGARLARIPAFLNEAEWISYRNGRVKTWSQYAYRDDPSLGGFQSGMVFASGERKDAVYEAWRMPLFVRLVGRSTIEVWGAARPRGSRGRVVQIEQRLRGQPYRDLRRPVRITSYRGYFRTRVRLSRADDRVYRVTYRTADGRTLRSRSTRAARRP